MKRTVAVFGATGLVGKELVAQLIKNEEPEIIKIVVRKQLTLVSPRVKQIILPDLSNLNEYHDVLKADVFFCCIGTTIGKAGSREAFSKVDFDIPIAIARLAVSLSVPSMVIISSLGANPVSSNFYLRTKGQMEKSVGEIYKGNLKFVRPSLLTGKREEFRFGEKLSIIFMKIFSWTFTGCLRKYRGISASDVARGMIFISTASSDTKIYESDDLQKIANSLKQF